MKKLIFTIIILLVLSGNALSQIAIIANKTVPADSISKVQLIDYFSRDIKTWDNDIPIVIVDLKEKGEVKNTFYKYLGKTSSRMKSIWMKKKLSGEGNPPASLISEEEVLKKVASTPGAIGFISRSKVTDEVKILRTIEKSSPELK
ncbi:MAG: hypothetical protein GY863_03045 [bacterium]|nr:hypothetical protein [bacterium]